MLPHVNAVDNREAEGRPMVMGRAVTRSLLGWRFIYTPGSPMRFAIPFALLCVLAAPATAKDDIRPSEDLSTYPNILSNEGDGTQLFLHVGGDVGPFAGITLNTHTSFYIPRVITASLDFGIGFGTGDGGTNASDDFDWGPNPWFGAYVGYPVVNAAHRGGGRYVISRQQVSANTIQERYLNVELPTYRQLTLEGAMVHGTPHFDFDSRATAFGAGLRYRVHWAAGARFNTNGGSYSPHLNHTWYLTAHVLFAQVGPTPSKGFDVPIGFNVMSAFPLFNDRDTNANMTVGFGLFPEGGMTFRWGFEWAGLVL